MNEPPCDTCLEPMSWRGTRYWWEGDYEFTEKRYECRNACVCEAALLYKTFIPVDVARMRD